MYERAVRDAVLGVVHVRIGVLGMSAVPIGEQLRKLCQV